MRFPIIWTAPAGAQLAEVYAYIFESSPGAAESQIQMVVGATRNLSEYPEMGRPGRRRGMRELAISATPYIVVYRIRLSSVRVLAVIHGARRWPKTFGL